MQFYSKREMSWPFYSRCTDRVDVINDMLSFRKCIHDERQKKDMVEFFHVEDEGQFSQD